MNHTKPNIEGKENNFKCSHTSIVPLLDTLHSTENGQVVTDLFKKPADKNLDLLLNSCHPPDTTKNTPFNVSLRKIGICKNPLTRYQRYA